MTKTGIAIFIMILIMAFAIYKESYVIGGLFAYFALMGVILAIFNNRKPEPKP